MLHAGYRDPSSALTGRIDTEMNRREFLGTLGLASAAVAQSPPRQKADFTLRIGPVSVELAPKKIVRTTGYNGTTPAVNPYYQPVGNGTSGPQTGQNTCVAQYGTARGCANIPANTYAFTNGAYLLTNGNVGNWQLAPLAPMSFNLFYKRQL